ncbi:hypothetical protein DV453_003100 [Geotrichum candidum]|nr:hypothetical protein DV453_003100 [Geotrichum candidum]
MDSPHIGHVRVVFWAAEVSSEVTELDDSTEPTRLTDFSIIHTSRNGNANLLLGPARFVNHDCSPNCSFSRKGKRISLRAIKNISPGQEVTVTYAKNYFGYRNRECRCVTCEVRGVNGFGTLNDYNSDEDSSDTDALTKLKRQKRQQNKLNNLAGMNADQDETSSLVSSPAVEIIDSESTLHSSRSPSVTADAETPASSLEPFPDKTSGQEVPLKRRLRQREEDINVEDKLFNFTFEDDDANFNATRDEWSSEDDDSDDESSEDELSEEDSAVAAGRRPRGRPRKIVNSTRQVGRPRKFRPLEIETKSKRKSSTKLTVPAGRPGRALNNGRGNGRHLSHHKRLEDPDTSDNEDEHESDSEEDEIIVTKTIRAKRTYKKRQPEILQSAPRKQPRLTFDAEDNSRSRRASPDEATVRRPLYVVPLNSDKPMCILNPPTGASGSIFLTSANGEKITIAAPGSDFMPTDMSPLRESISINDLSQRSVVPDVAAVAVGGAGISYLVNGETRERTRQFRYPKIKTIGLISKRTDDYSSPSWKLLQQVQSSRY